MNNSLVSIIIPVFNRKEIVSTTLDSIVCQSYSSWECIVVDDGSIDGTFELLESYAKKDERFKIFSRPENLAKGANACRNYGFLKAEGDYINWFDSDDIMEPDFILEKVKPFKTGIDAVLHKNRYSNYNLTRFRESKFKYISPEHLFFHFAIEDIEIQTNGFMWRRAYLENKELFDCSVERYQDNDFHIRMLAYKPRILILNKVLATIRGGDGDLSQISSKQNLTKKKLFDIFNYRVTTVILNNTSMHNKCLVFNIISQKALWSFYEFLKFEKNPFTRLVDFFNNYRKVKLLYSFGEYNSTRKIKSLGFIAIIIFFGSFFKK